MRRLLAALLLLAPALASAKPSAPKQPPPDALQQKLKSRVHAEFQETPFKDVLDYFRKSAGVEVVVDPSATKQVEGLLDKPVTAKTPGAGTPLEDFLTQVATGLGVSWTTKDGKILIVAKQK